MVSDPLGRLRKNRTDSTGLPQQVVRFAADGAADLRGLTPSIETTV
jgi:hypothetical protein